MKLTKIKYLIFVFFITGISVFLLNTDFRSGIKYSYELTDALKIKSGEKLLIWIFFEDKGDNIDKALITPEKFLTQRSIERRIKRIKSGKTIDYRDIPVYSGYIEELKDAGIKIRNKSKWFNGVSCYADKRQIEIITHFDFVKRLELVRKYRDRPDFENNFEANPSNQNLPDNPNSINYGPSLNQSNLISIPPAHDLGYSGDGVLIASFDAGFDNLSHNCFDKIRQKGLRTYDFVNGDTIVGNIQGHHGDGSHGTRTLSLIAAYDPGWLVSPAYNSSYILAKTENTESETPLEEDNWIAAAEWADSLGADIITSSLGYLDDFTPPYSSYTWQDMDGRTARITIGAEIAVSKGIVVVNSAGNDGDKNFPNTLNAPADGDSVITVGAVFLNKKRAPFSSYGPTADGRMKPDVMALGVSNYTARFGEGNLGYINSASGTSLSTPMVAGVCALMLSANPNLTPIQIRDILRRTADSSMHPNNLRGWGIANAYLAVTSAIDLKHTREYHLAQNYPNPFNPITNLDFSISDLGFVSLRIYNLLGKEVTTLINENKSAGNYSIKFSGNNLSSGIYFYSLIVNGNLIDTKKMVLVK